MKGLRKVLTPFAPDQSGAVSVLYALGGAVIIVDAGGCTGNICGFDEPRFETQAAAVFSAGLRDMDAILGRDQLLVDKAVEIAESLHPKFVALVGTPVPAVIGTDLKSLCRLIEKKSGVPAFAVATNGTSSTSAGRFTRLRRSASGREARNETPSASMDGQGCPLCDAGRHTRLQLRVQDVLQPRGEGAEAD